jgi:3-deoxy-D-manno-octulosonate 8-phosphate phosphatase (KDO 8-P phosphatase)
LIFDWDGIFNSGAKGTVPSNFNEIDSMGINMLRFGIYLLHKTIPFTAIVTGENNETAFHWAKREHLDVIYYKVKDKKTILPELKKNYNILPEEILFVFDDILDLSLAKKTGLRFLVRHASNPLFTEYCRQNHLCDYITRNSGDQKALREISELSLYLTGKFTETIEGRIRFDGPYNDFLQLKTKRHTKVLKASAVGFTEIEP